MSSRSIMTPANVVTMLRILLSPVVVAVIYFYAPAWWVLAIGFFSMITDKVDGYLARKYGVSNLGIFLDPLADKFMLLGSMTILVIKGWVWWLPIALIAAREFAMSYWRSRLAAKGVSFPARRSGKYKTWAQSFVVAAAVTPGVIDNAKWVVTALVWAAVFITLYSFFQYVRDARLHSQGPVKN